MPSCAVLGCKNNCRTEFYPKLRFYTFPSSEPYRSQWINFCRRSSTFNFNKSAVICARHFSPKYRQHNMKNRLLGLNPKRARDLTFDAVPDMLTPEDIEKEKALGAKIVSEKGKNQVQQKSEAVIATEFHECTMSQSALNNPKTLFDFTKASNLDDWIEISDTVREVGQSKATFVLQKTRLFQRAIFFTVLNPQPNGAGFAGVSTRSSFDLKDYNTLELYARAQGNVSNYKIVLRHKGQNNEPHPTYEQFFTMPLEEFTTISLPLSNFDPYYRGRKLNSSEAEPLDKSQISSFGFQVYGGVYLPKKQSGVSALEIDWVKAS